jgi:hypothetical protein
MNLILLLYSSPLTSFDPVSFWQHPLEHLGTEGDSAIQQDATSILIHHDNPQHCTTCTSSVLFLSHISENVPMHCSEALLGNCVPTSSKNMPLKCELKFPKSKEIHHSVKERIQLTSKLTNFNRLCCH